MSKYEEGIQILNERFGNGRDNAIALATISRIHTRKAGQVPGFFLFAMFFESEQSVSLIFITEPL